MNRSDIEGRVAAFAHAVRYFRWIARITGVVMLSSGVVGLLEGRLIPLALVAVGPGFGFSWLGWIIKVDISIGDVYWSTDDARVRRRFRRAIRRELR